MSTQSARSGELPPATCTLLRTVNGSESAGWPCAQAGAEAALAKRQPAGLQELAGNTHKLVQTHLERGGLPSSHMFTPQNHKRRAGAPDRRMRWQGPRRPALAKHQQAALKGLELRRAAVAHGHAAPVPYVVTPGPLPAAPCSRLHDAVAICLARPPLTDVPARAPRVASGETDKKVVRKVSAG